MGIRKEEKDLRVVRLTIQVTPEEKELIKLMAKKEGQTISEYIRRISLYIPYNEIFKG